MTISLTSQFLDLAFDDWFMSGQKQARSSQPQFPKAEAIAARVREDLHLPHQKAFLEDTTHKFLGLVAGFGAGKTRSLVGKAVLLAIANPGCLGILMEPTNTMVRTLLIPEFTERLHEWGVCFTLTKTPLPEITLYFDGFTFLLYLRSFENWNRIRGDNAAFALIDEFDTVEPRIGEKAWQLIQGRIRKGAVRQIGIVSTPEGYKQVYSIFVTNANGDRHLIKAKTTDNIYLPPDYIDSLRANYPPELIEAYINGEFVNLNTSSVYPEFDRVLNSSDRGVLADDILHIGVDFNINKMASVVHVIDGKAPIAVDEFYRVRDTVTLISNIKQRYPEHYQKGRIWIYPDASGANRHTSASKSDVELLREAGLKVNCRASNPPIRDRILTMQTMFLNAKGERRYLVNVSKCPEYTKCLTQQGYDEKGLPDKTKDEDHLPDAAGYFIYSQYSFIHQRAGSGTGIKIY